MGVGQSAWVVAGNQQIGSLMGKVVELWLARAQFSVGGYVSPVASGDLRIRGFWQTYPATVGAVSGA
jgi:hypothetical protein